MGFFSTIGDIFTAVLPVAGAVLGGPALGGALAAITSPEVQRAASVATGGLGNITDPALAAKIGPGTAVAGAGCPASANSGTLRRRTVVQTFCPATGTITKQEVHQGAPAVFQSDVAASNRLNRALKRLNKAQPRKMIQQSTTAMLKQQVIENALRNAAGFDGACPTK